VSESAPADIAGAYALARLEAEYMRARVDDRPAQDLDDLREAICLVRGWRFEP
jgi:hypothetical protein